MSTSVVITGLGIASPHGSELGQYSQVLFQQINNIKTKHLGQIDLADVPHGLTPRQLKKLDRFTILAIAATKAALNDSRFQLSDDSQHSTGLFFGNVFGGWSYVEEQMYALCNEGMSAINSYVATAWFPAAPQGEISILEKLAGASKTFSAGELSSAYAIEHAFDLIANNTLAGALAGGCESPGCDLVRNSLVESGDITTSSLDTLTESAAIVFMETKAEAIKRKARIYARINHFTYATTAIRAIELCLLELDTTNILIISSQNIPDSQLPLLNFAEFNGKSFGADFAVNIVNACLLLSADNGLQMDFNTVLVVGSNGDKGSLCIALTKD